MKYFAIRVEPDEDRWVSTCCEVDERGNGKEGAGAVAPRFYGLTAEQAHRRMRDALENTYDRVEPCLPNGHE